MTYHHDIAPQIDLECSPIAPANLRAAEDMTPDQYRDALSHFGLGINEAGRFFGVGDKTARKFAEEGPSDPVAKLLKFMLAKDFMPEDVNSAIRRWEREAS